MAAASFLLGLLFLGPGVGAGAGDEAAPAPEGRFAAFKGRFDARERRFYAETEAASRLPAAAQPAGVAAADEARALIRAQPADPAALEGMIALIADLRQPLDDDFVRLVRDRFRADPRLGRPCLPPIGRPEESAGASIGEVAAHHPDPTVRGQATFALASWSRLAGEGRPGRRARPPQQEAQLRGEARRYFEQVAAGDADLAAPDGRFRLADRARAEPERLDNLAQLKVGGLAPEIVGVDLDGRPLRLGDYRGRVVLASWGTWCAPCMAMVPHERARAARLAGKPFARLGVNSDQPDDRARAVRATRDRRMTWPSWWDGGFRGAIQVASDTKQFPTVYVIDPRGVIRFINVDGRDFDRAVDALLAEPGTAPPTNPPRCAGPAAIGVVFPCSRPGSALHYGPTSTRSRHDMGQPG